MNVLRDMSWIVMRRQVCLFLVAWSVLSAEVGHATVYFEWTFESESCDAVLTDTASFGSPTARRIDWGETYTGNERPIVRCSLSSPDPSGNHYYEVQPTANRGGDAISITWPSDLNLTDGQVYYFGWFHRIDRQGHGNPWIGGGSQSQSDMDSYDKGLDWGRQDTAGDTRWVISVGYPNAVYNSSAYVQNGYSYDLWCPANSSPIFSCSSAQVFDSVPANVSPYSTTQIKSNDFEKWHAVYVEVKMGTGTSGYIKLFVDGVLTHNKQNITTAGSTAPRFNRLWLNSTLSQPTYNTPARAIQVDHILFTDSFADIQTAKLDEDPNAVGGVSGSNPTGTKPMHPMIHLRR